MASGCKVVIECEGQRIEATGDGCELFGPLLAGAVLAMRRLNTGFGGSDLADLGAFLFGELAGAAQEGGELWHFVPGDEDAEHYAPRLALLQQAVEAANAFRDANLESQGGG